VGKPQGLSLIVYYLGVKVMFCTKCGATTSIHDRFCAKCGANVNTKVVQESIPKVTRALPVFSTPVLRGFGKFETKSVYPPGYEWLGEKNTILICKNHVVVIKGGKKRNTRALDVMPALGLVGGAIGVTINIFGNKKSELTPANADILFENKQMVWCNKSDAEIWRYETKSRSSKLNSDQLYCKFNSMDGIINCCVVIVYVSGGVKGVQKVGVDFAEMWTKVSDFFKIEVIERNITDDDNLKIMEISRMKRLPD
jgi:hypothetical protein